MVNKSTGVIWAQMRSSPYWPARIELNPPKAIGKIPPDKVCVFFFGSKNYGKIDSDKIASYLPNRERYTRKGKCRGKKFMDAVKSCDDFISDPNKYYSNSVPDSDASMLTIQKEPPVGKQEIEKIVVKQEIEDPDFDMCEYQTVPVENMISQNRSNESLVNKVEEKLSYGSKPQSSNDETTKISETHSENVSEQEQTENKTGNDLQIHFIELKTRITEMVTKSEKTHTALIETVTTLSQVEEKYNNRLDDLTTQLRMKCNEYDQLKQKCKTKRANNVKIQLDESAESEETQKDLPASKFDHSAISKMYQLEIIDLTKKYKEKSAECEQVQLEKCSAIDETKKKYEIKITDLEKMVHTKCDECDQLKKENLSAHKNKISKVQFKELEAKNIAIVGELDEVKAKLDAVNVLKRQCDEKRVECEQLKQENQSLKTKCTNIDALQSSFVNLQAEKSALVLALQEAKDSQHRLESKINEVENNYKLQLTDFKEKLQNDHAKLVQAESIKSDMIKEHELQLDILRKQCDEKSTEHEQLKQDYTSIKTKCVNTDILQSQLKTIEAEYCQLSSTLKEAKAALLTFETSHDEIKKKCTSLTEKLEEKGKECDQLKQLQNKLTEAGNLEIDNLKIRLRKLEAEHNLTVIELEKTRTDLVKSESNQGAIQNRCERKISDLIKQCAEKSAECQQLTQKNMLIQANFDEVSFENHLMASKLKEPEKSSLKSKAAREKIEADNITQINSLPAKLKKRTYESEPQKKKVRTDSNLSESSAASRKLNSRKRVSTTTDQKQLDNDNKGALSNKQTQQKSKKRKSSILIKHKIEKGIISYLVRWTGFSSEHDSWVTEKNLKCPEILNTYKEKNNLI